MSGTTSGTTSGATDPAAAVRARIDQAAEDGFEGSLLVRFEGELLLAEGHGLANRDERRPNDAATAFDFGSVMKDFTAVAIFELQESGALTLDDPIGGLLPDVPDDKADITIRQLLLHRAGFDEYHDVLGDFEPMSREQARERILGQTLRFDPGTSEAYSNSGYTLLADIIEEVSGLPYLEFIRTRLLMPAGMSSSGFFGDRVWQDVPTAVGYGSDTFEDNDPATWPVTWALIGNGGLVSTVEDLDRWHEALVAGEVLSAEGLEAYSTEYLPGPFAADSILVFSGAGDFGLGGVIFESPLGGVRVVLGSNSWDTYNAEQLAVDLGSSLLE